MASATTDRRLGLTSDKGIKAPVAAATLTNITLSGEQTIDGVAVKASNVAGYPDRVLVKNQTSAIDNGIWDVSTGQWTRSLDSNGSQDLVTGTAFYIVGGSQAGQIWSVSSTGSIVPGTSSISFSQSLTSSAANALQALLALSSGATLIGWIRSASNAVVTTISKWMNRQEVNVFDFMTDAQIADVQAYTYTLDVTAAVTAAKVAAAGGTIICPDGGYLFNSASIELSDSTNTSVYRPAPKFRGAGLGRTIFLNRYADYLFKHTQTSAQATAGSFARGFKWSGIDLICDGSSPAGAAGFDLSGAYFPVFEDCRLYGLKGNAITTLNKTVSTNSDGFSCATVTLNRMTITACAGWGVLGTAFSTDYHLKDCYVTSNYGGFCNVGSGNIISGGATAGNSITGNTGSTIAVTSVSWSGGIATVTTTSPIPAGWATGDAVLINGATGTGYCGVHYLTKTGASTFTYPVSTNPGSTAGTITAMQMTGGVIFAYQGGNQSMNSKVEHHEIQLNGVRQIWFMGQNNVSDHCRILDDDQGTATFHAPNQIDIGGCTGSLSDGNKVLAPLFRLTSASGTPAVNLVRVNLSATGGVMSARWNSLEEYRTAITGSPVVTPMSVTNPTDVWAIGNCAFPQSLPKGSVVVIATTKNIADATGTQAITGVGFMPTSITIRGFLGAMYTFGTVDTNLANKGIYYYPTGTQYGNTSGCIRFRTGAGDEMDGTITSFDADGCTISWVKTGVPTGTADLQLEFHN